jgi:hypothetical protein
MATHSTATWWKVRTTAPGASCHLVLLYRDGLLRDQDMRGGSSIGAGTCGGHTATVILNPTSAIEVEIERGSCKPVPDVWMLNLEAVAPISAGAAGAIMVLPFICFCRGSS